LECEERYHQGSGRARGFWPKPLLCAQMPAHSRSHQEGRPSLQILLPHETRASRVHGNPGSAWICRPPTPIRWYRLNIPRPFPGDTRR